MADEIIDVTIPELGEDVKKVTIVDWLKRPGDFVEVEELLLEVMTDKANMEVISPAAGTLTKILFEKDAVVEVGMKVGELKVGN